MQLGDQSVERDAHLVDAGFTALLGVEHGFFKAREQCRQRGVHVIGAHGFAHFFHALVNGAVGAFGRQRAAHQAAAQQVKARVPAPFEFVLLLDALQVFFFPA